MLCLSLLTLALVPALLARPVSFAEQEATVMHGGSGLEGSGSYTITNVANGRSLAFTRTRVTNFFPVSSSSSPLAVEVRNGLVRMCGGNNKCASAQWSTTAATRGGGADNAAVSYAKNDNLGAKQWWSFVKASKSKDGEERYYIIATDHASDQPARAITGDQITTFGGYESTALADWSKGASGQLWKVVKH